MSTVRDLISGSLRLIGAQDPGEAVDPIAAQNALIVLNDMLDAWGIERLLIFHLVRKEYSLTPNKGAYTLGIGGDFDDARPARIEEAGFLVGDQVYPLEVIESDRWAKVFSPGLASGFPCYLYNEGGFPQATLHLWPVPTAADRLVLHTWEALGAFPTINTEVSLPPGYAKALRFNLALELAPEYGRDPSGVVVKTAQESKAALKRLNLPAPVLVVDPALGLSGNCGRAAFLGGL